MADHLELPALDRTYAATMAETVATGVVPHYAELAAKLDQTPLVTLEQLRTIIDRTPGWFHPGTDYIASFPPFNNQPTQYRITVDGGGRWFAQCGFEALAVRWLFPGQTVTVDAPPGTRAKDVACKITPTSVSLKIRGSDVALEGALADRVNADDSMSVRFTTNVTEANLPPEKVRLCPGKCPPSTKNYRASSPATTDLKVGDCVTAPFEKNTPPEHEGYPGKIVKLDALAGCCDVNFKFNTNVSFHYVVRYVTI